MEISNKTVWVIMTKCRKYIAKGTPRNRELIEVNRGDKLRYLTYSSKAMAESGFKRTGFSTYRLVDFPYDNSYKGDRTEFLEAVECQMILKTI